MLFEENTHIFLQAIKSTKEFYDSLIAKAIIENKTALEAFNQMMFKMNNYTSQQINEATTIK